MKPLEIFLRILAIWFRAVLETVTPTLKAISETTKVLVDEVLVPFTMDAHYLIDQLENRGVKHIRDKAEVRDGSY